MQEWILEEMNVRCHATRLHVPCERRRGYDSIIPCPQELMNYLAEDYAVTQGWCNFSHPAAYIPVLGNVDAGAAKAFQQPSLTQLPTKAGSMHDRAEGSNRTQVPINTFMTDGTEGRTGARNVRLAFFFTVYADAAFVTRLFKKLYSPTHYYLFHLDAGVGSVSSEFAATMRQLADTHPNVFLTQDVPIVYGASTATILLTKAMAWFDKHATGWDYFVPLTGSDYPLIPLARIEEIFTFQQPPMPFVMAWTPGKHYGNMSNSESCRCFPLLAFENSATLMCTNAMLCICCACIQAHRRTYSGWRRRTRCSRPTPSSCAPSR